MCLPRTRNQHIIAHKFHVDTCISRVEFSNFFTVTQSGYIDSFPFINSPRTHSRARTNRSFSQDIATSRRPSFWTTWQNWRCQARLDAVSSNSQRRHFIQLDGNKCHCRPQWRKCVLTNNKPSCIQPATWRSRPITRPYLRATQQDDISNTR